MLLNWLHFKNSLKSNLNSRFGKKINPTFFQKHCNTAISFYFRIFVQNNPLVEKMWEMTLCGRRKKKGPTTAVRRWNWVQFYLSFTMAGPEGRNWKQVFWKNTYNLTNFLKIWKKSISFLFSNVYFFVNLLKWTLNNVHFKMTDK